MEIEVGMCFLFVCFLNFSKNRFFFKFQESFNHLSICTTVFVVREDYYHCGLVILFNVLSHLLSNSVYFVSFSDL